MKHLSRKEIEAIAARVVTAYKKLPELEGQAIYRIEPELLIRNLLGLNINILFYRVFAYSPKVLLIDVPVDRVVDM